jgi:hypothetical protein
MLKRILSLAVIGLLLNLVCYSSVGASSKPNEVDFAAKVKAAIAKLGVGSDARVEVRLRNKTKLKGYVSEANENGFVVVDEKTGVATQVTYPQVKKVKGKNNLSGEKIAIGIFIAALIVVGILYGTDRIDD